MLKRISLLTAAVTIMMLVPATPAGAQVVPPPTLNPLNQIAVPEPPNLYQYVTNKQAAIQLGKAFFWDMQAGSDGQTACATCHFSAGADNRLVNTLNPGTRAGDTEFGNPSLPELAGLGMPQFSANYTLDITPVTGDFPFHERAGNGHLQTQAIIRDVNDVVGSQGVRKSTFVGIVEGRAEDDVIPVVDTVFTLDPDAPSVDKNLRQVTARNTPTVINAVHNFTQFWDGRASFIFNGENPFGPLDQSAGVWFNDLTQGLVKRPMRLIFGSLASQAVGPPLDDVEMSAAGRTFPELGRKMLSLTPLGKQYVSHDDSVLGGLAMSSQIPGAKGLHDTYAELIQRAFHDELWDSTDMVTVTVRGQPVEFTQMEANFAFFWGVAIQLYEATLVPDQTPYDHWLGGDSTALTEEQKNGFALFTGVGKCSLCHIGIETTAASYSSAAYTTDFTNALMEIMFVADGRQIIYDNGYNNTAVTPTVDDIGRGGTAPFLNPNNNNAAYPLSFSALAELQAQGKLSFSVPILEPHLPVDFPINVNGAFKVPGLRNVELTTPYFHNGSTRSLDDVLDLYIRGGNFPVENVHDLDADVAGGLSQTLNNEAQEHAVAAFMRSLTDPRVAIGAAPFDHPELFVPNGVDINGDEIFMHVPANNIFGETILPSVSVNAVSSPTRLNTQTITGTVKNGLTPQITVNQPGVTVGAISYTDNNTRWSAPVSDLAEGSNIFTITVVDNSVQPPATSVVTATITLDTIQPTLTFNPVTTPTQSATQTLTGNVEAGAAVRVSMNGGAPVPAVVSGTSWSYIAALKPGQNSSSVTASDAAGNSGAALAQVITHEVPPLAPFSVSLQQGWGMLSTPVTLDPAANTLDAILGTQVIRDNITDMIRWTGASWQGVDGSYVLQALDAIYIKVRPGMSATATLVAYGENSQPPSRTLSAGIHLVGIAPAYESGYFPTRSVSQALYTIAQAPGGMIGYSSVISPSHNQIPWAYVPGDPMKDMLPFKGYWVVMTNPAVLAGTSTTPIRQ